MEDKSLDERLEEAERLPIRYKPIEKDKDYKREDFLYTQDELNDLEQYANAITKDPFNLNAREDLSNLLFGKPAFHKTFPAETIKRVAIAPLENGVESMARYVKKNEDEFFNILDGNSYLGLVMSLPLYKTGEKEHDGLVALIDDVQAMNEAIRNKDFDKMREFVHKKTESDKVSDWAKNLINYFSDDDRFMTSLFEVGYSAKNQILMGELIAKDSHEPDRDKLMGLVKDSLAKAEEMYDEETDRDKQKDIWKSAIRPYYAAIAKYAYPIEKKEIEKSNDKKDADKREDERRKIGMPL